MLSDIPQPNGNTPVVPETHDKPNSDNLSESTDGYHPQALPTGKFILVFMHVFIATYSTFLSTELIL